MIEQIIIIALTVFAIWQTFQEGHIFNKVAIVLEKKLPEKLHNPIFYCPVCMCFWYGLVICLLFDFGLWLPVPAMGLVAVIVNILPDE